VSAIGLNFNGKGGRYIKGDFSAIHRMAAQLSRLAIGNQGGILAAGMEVATESIVQGAKARLTPQAGVDTGALKKSLDNKVKNYEDGGVVVGIMGPRTDAYNSGKSIKKRRGESRAAYRERTKGMERPSNYAHLVEFGHRSVHGGGALPNNGERVKGVWNSVNKGRSLRKRTISATSFVAPIPFLRPAFDAGIGQLESTLADATKEAMEKEFSKISK